MISLCCFVSLDVCEMAHDVQMQVFRYVTREMKLLNSYDTWHDESFILSYVTD